MKRHIFILLSASIITFLVAISAYGQADVATATLTGTVTDQAGAVVPGAKVTISQPDRGFQKTVVSDAGGAYQIPLLPPGIYQVETEAQGFSKTLTTNLELTVGQTQVYNISLRVGAVNNVVEVTADAPLIQLEQTQQADTINPAQVENLPNIDRNFTQAVYTLPGVSNAVTPRSSGQTPGF
ncbi:MAG TPA: carboxypeptidase-like regulatory domain-containing protein, partial [Blastocatellia bacterium]